MDDKKNVTFRRLLSDESTGSTLSSDSCEYYQTEIFDLLPSIQASRPEQNRRGPVEATEAYQDGSESVKSTSHDHLSKGTEDKSSKLPLRNRAMCMQAKRGVRERRKMQISNIGFWESWRRSQSINRKRSWAQMGQMLSSLLPLQHTLHKIEGRFGVGVKAYFVFLRYLIYLNLLHCVLILGFIMGPTAYYGRGNNKEPLTFGGNDSILDFFLGTGFLDRSPAFFGFYEPGSLSLPCLNTSLLYLAGILTIVLLSLILVVRRTAIGYKHTWMLGKRYNINVCFKIFCGWDFTIHDPAAAALKQSFITNDLKLFLAEQSFSLQKAQRTLGYKVRLYLLRFILNLVVLSLLVGAFCLIYVSTYIAEVATMKHHWFPTLIGQYLPPMSITFVNLVLPHIFSKIASFEDYSFTVQVNTTLVRSIFLKLASLGIYLYFIVQNLYKKPSAKCSENEFGREMYKLCIFNFIAIFCNAFLFNYPRKLLLEHYPTSLLARLSGKPYFLIPFNVLDLVYAQTVSWIGVYYCPLLPLLGTIFLIATFYIKKFNVLRCCVAEQRMFRASSVLFHFMLLLGLLMAVSSLGLHLYPKEAKNNSTNSCGPIGKGDVFNVTDVCVKSLPSPAQTAFRYLTSEAFAFSLILAEIIILTSYVSRGGANRKAIERLKDMLVMSSSDKRFLVKQHATLQRSRKNTSRVRSASHCI